MALKQIDYSNEKYDVLNHLKSLNQTSIESWFSQLLIYDPANQYVNQPYNILKAITIFKVTLCLFII
jgi:hypothetical protein